MENNNPYELAGRSIRVRNDATNYVNAGKVYRTFKSEDLAAARFADLEQIFAVCRPSVASEENGKGRFVFIDAWGRHSYEHSDTDFGTYYFDYNLGSGKASIVLSIEDDNKVTRYATVADALAAWDAIVSPVEKDGYFREL